MIDKEDIDSIKFIIHSGSRIYKEAIENAIDKYKIENNMKLFEIWMEGFAITGHHGVAQKLGEAYGTTFEEAVESYKSKHPDNNIQHDDRGYHIWACKLYDNEKDARKSFG